MFWWLSFASDSGFLGATIVKGAYFTEAVQEAQRLGVNPGGEVQGMPLAKAKTEADLLPFVPNKLYSKAEIDAIDKAVKW